MLPPEGSNVCTFEPQGSCRRWRWGRRMCSWRDRVNENQYANAAKSLFISFNLGSSHSPRKIISVTEPTLGLPYFLSGQRRNYFCLIYAPFNSFYDFQFPDR